MAADASAAQRALENKVLTIAELAILGDARQLSEMGLLEESHHRYLDLMELLNTRVDEHEKPTERDFHSVANTLIDESEHIQQLVSRDVTDEVRKNAIRELEKTRAGSVVDLARMRKDAIRELEKDGDGLAQPALTT